MKLLQGMYPNIYFAYDIKDKETHNITIKGDDKDRIEFIEDMRIAPEGYKKYSLYESQVLRLYPVSKEEFGQFDTKVFDQLEKKYHDYWKNKNKS